MFQTAYLCVFNNKDYGATRKAGPPQQCCMVMFTCMILLILHPWYCSSTMIFCLCSSLVAVSCLYITMILLRFEAKKKRMLVWMLCVHVPQLLLCASFCVAALDRGLPLFRQRLFKFCKPYHNRSYLKGRNIKWARYKTTEIGINEHRVRSR